MVVVVVVVEGLKVELQLSTLTLQFTVLLSAVLYRMTCPGVKAIQIDITKIEIHADPDPTGFSLGFSFTAPIRAFCILEVPGGTWYPPGYPLPSFIASYYPVRALYSGGDSPLGPWRV